MRMTNPKSNMPLLPPGSRPKRPIPPNSSGPKPIRPPKGGVMPMAMGGTVQGQFGTVKPRPTPRPGTNMPLVINPPSGKPMGKPMGKPGVKMAMGGTVKVRPTSPGGVSAVRPGENYFSGKAKKFPGMTLRPGDVTNKPSRLPPGMKPPIGLKKGGMATKKKAGMAIMIAIGKPKGRGKS